MIRCFCLGLFVVGMISNPCSASAGTILITKEEASLPAEKFIFEPRGISRAPQAELVEPNESAHSPMHFHIRFKSFGGSKINIATLQVTYLKDPEVDLLPRVTRFTEDNGIDISDAEIPPGEHFLRIVISDSEGRTRTTILRLKVLP